MTLPIERFKDSYQNWRYNPFTATDMAIDKEEDGLIIPSGSPFVIQLLEQARYNDPTSVSVRCYGVDTFVDETSAVDQKVLKVDDTNGFSPGDNVIINRGGAREEEKIIDTIQVGISLTVTVNLEYEHTAGQADDVEKFIAFTETAGAPAQSQFRVDYPPDNGEGTGLVEFNQNDADKEVRISYKATGSPALAETLDTKISYPTGTPGDDQFAGFSSGAPIWRDFSHANLTGVGTDDHHAQVHTLGSHSDFSTYLNQAVKSSSSPTFVDLQVGRLRLKDMAGGHFLNLVLDEDLSASRTLNIRVGDAPSSLTLSGGVTLANWFDQAVKTGSTPSFSKLNLTHAASTLQGGTRMNLLAGSQGIRSLTINDDTSGFAANMYISPADSWMHRSTSALKYKDKVENLELDPSLIHKLRVVSFNSKCEGDDKKRRLIGLIADDVERILPEIILYNEKNEAEGYDGQMLLALVIAELQKLKKQMTN